MAPAQFTDVTGDTLTIRPRVGFAMVSASTGHGRTVSVYVSREDAPAVIEAIGSDAGIGGAYLTRLPAVTYTNGVLAAPVGDGGTGWYAEGADPEELLDKARALVAIAKELTRRNADAKAREEEAEVETVADELRTAAVDPGDSWESLSDDVRESWRRAARTAKERYSNA